MFLWRCLANAQVITGVVCDFATKLPVSDVFVYLDGTTINTITNISGRFELKTKSVINTKLVLHHLSYETAIIGQPFKGLPDTLYIKERVKTIREVTVYADRFTREQKMKVFREQFLGMSRAGKSCTIMNEDDIQLTVNLYTRRLVASCDKPIVVINDYLGYQITFILVDFWVQYGILSRLDSDYAQSSFFSVVSLFTDMAPDSRRIKRRRDNTYELSSNHFFKSFANDSLKDYNFVLFNKMLPIDPSQYFSIKDTLSQKMISIIPCAVMSSDTVVQSVSNNYEFRNDTVMQNERITDILAKRNFPDSLMRKPTSIGTIPKTTTSCINKGENMFYTGPKPSGIISVLLRRKLLRSNVQSDIYFMTDSFRVDRYGNIDKIEKILFVGQMAENRAGDMLPIDYASPVTPIETKQMTLTFQGSGLKAIYLSGTGTVTIDWGDGSPIQTGPLLPINESEWNNLDTWYKYGVKNDYSETSTYTITISGENITHLNCMNHEAKINHFTGLDVSKNTNLQELNCANNQLTSLDISKNTELSVLHCSFNRLENLDVSSNIKLKKMFCVSNPLTSLNFKNNAALTLLMCGGHLTSLDVSGAAALTELSCTQNPLTKLDLSKNTKLERLIVERNQLTNLKISKNSELTFINCEFNQLSDNALNELFGMLNSDPDLKGKTISIGNNPGTDTCNQSIATEKSWTVNK